MTILPDDGTPQAADLALLRLIQVRTQMSQRQLAASLGMSLGKANHCLRALINAGFVKVENYRSSTHKLAYLYLLTPRGVARKAELTQRFLARKMRDYEALRLEIEQLRRESEGVTDAPAVPSRNARGNQELTLNE